MEGNWHQNWSQAAKPRNSTASRVMIREVKKQKKKDVKGMARCSFRFRNTNNEADETNMKHIVCSVLKRIHVKKNQKMIRLALFSVSHNATFFHHQWSECFTQ